MSWHVTCEDGRVRHAGGFDTRADAEEFAEWGHVCTNRHSFGESDPEGEGAAEARLEARADQIAEYGRLSDYLTR